MKIVTITVLLLGLLNPSAHISVVDDNKILIEENEAKRMLIISENQDRTIHTDVVQLHLLYGTWKDTETGVILELNPDGTWTQGSETGTYSVQDAASVRLTVDGQSETIPYELNGNRLQWGEEQILEKAD